MLERVARAIYRRWAVEQQKQTYTADYTLEDDVDNAWPLFEAEARDALEAMKYVDGTDEDRLVAASNTYRVEAVSLSQAWDHIIQAALDGK